MGSIKKAFDLAGKTALVTGGSRGLGLQIAEAFGEQGARIVLSSRKAGDLKQAQDTSPVWASSLIGSSPTMLRTMTSSGSRTRQSTN